VVLLLAPLIAHWCLFGHFVWTLLDDFAFGRVDFAVALLSVVYAAMVPVIARKPAGAAKFILLSYSLLIAIGIGEIVTRRAFPLNLPRAPWPTVHRAIDVDPREFPGL